MLDVEKNELALSILGDERARELVKAFPLEPIYPHAVFHALQLKIIDEGLNNNDKIEDIAERADVSERTVLRRKKDNLGFNS
jgi:hypothetical protein